MFLFQSRKNRVVFWFNFSLAVESEPVKLLESIGGIKKKTGRGGEENTTGQVHFRTVE